MMFWLLLAQTTPPNGLAGDSGWLGAGLLGLVLAWLLWVHLPAKDKQIRELIADKDTQLEKLITAWSVDREKDRVSRHEVTNAFQKAITDLHTQHEQDAEKDRSAFLARTSGFMVELRTMLATVCRYQLPPAHHTLVNPYQPKAGQDSGGER